VRSRAIRPTPGLAGRGLVESRSDGAANAPSCPSAGQHFHPLRPRGILTKVPTRGCAAVTGCHMGPAATRSTRVPNPPERAQRRRMWYARIPQRTSTRPKRAEATAPWPMTSRPSSVPSPTGASVGGWDGLVLVTVLTIGRNRLFAVRVSRIHW